LKTSIKILLGVVVLLVVAIAAAAVRTVPPYVAGQRKPLEVKDATYSEHRLDRNGVKLLRRSLAPAAPQTPRGTLVIVHGLKDYSDRYQDFAMFLVRKGFRVETFDLRGHGDSEGDRVRIESFDDYLNDLDAVMAEVRAPSNPAMPAGALELREKEVAVVQPPPAPQQPPLFLFGHSMGGAIATRWTETRKPQLAGLILSAAALKADAPAPAVGFLGVVGSIVPKAPIFALDDTKFSRTPGVGESMAKDPLIYDGPAPARTLAELARTLLAIQDDAAKLEVPLLALHGEKDEVTPPSGSKELVAGASSKEKEAKLYPGLVHDLLHEPEAATVMDDIAAFMEKHAPATEPTPAPAPAP
jgi:acylglycerol lipase